MINIAAFLSVCCIVLMFVYMLSINVAVVCTTLVGLFIIGIRPAVRKMSSSAQVFRCFSILSKSKFMSDPTIIFAVYVGSLFSTCSYRFRASISCVFGIR